MITSFRIIGRRLYVLGFLLVGIFPVVALDFSGYGEDYSKKEAEKVLKLIAQMQRKQAEGDTRGLSKVMLTESELNSYIAYRIEAERSEALKELRLKIFENNRVEGKIYIDLRGQDLPKVLRPEMNFYLDGTIEVKEGSVRLNLKSLYLEGQKIQPQLLNMVIYVGSKAQNTEPFRLDDWFELPYGIKDIVCEQGCAAFYY